jgi:diadenylate cyclase
VIERIFSRFGSPPHFTFTWRDAIDILIVAFVAYFLLRLIRGTRAVQMVFGLIAILVVYWISVILKLVALRTVLSALIFYLPFAIIVLFAQELRRALAAVGRPPRVSEI